ncbi:Putative ATPase/DNA-binding SARP family transcriptional activator OS=Streptomyces griseomycini OX=66895 GN=FHS37_000493 PE=3 SV=1 [Streptomyces griseomycini]
MMPASHVTTAMERDCRERAAARVREVLDEEAYEAAYAEGAGLSVEEAGALV